MGDRDAPTASQLCNQYLGLCSGVCCSSYLQLHAQMEGWTHADLSVRRAQGSRVSLWQEWESLIWRQTGMPRRCFFFLTVLRPVSLRTSSSPSESSISSSAEKRIWPGKSMATITFFKSHHDNKYTHTKRMRQTHICAHTHKRMKNPQKISQYDLKTRFVFIHYNFYFWH